MCWAITTNTAIKNDFFFNNGIKVTYKHRKYSRKSATSEAYWPDSPLCYPLVNQE